MTEKSPHIKTSWMHLNQRHILQFSHELGIQVTPTWHSATKKREEKKGVVYAVSQVSDRSLFKYFPFLDREISHHFPPFIQKKKQNKTTDAKLQIYTESCGYQYFLWNHVWWWITNMYTSLHQKHTGGLTSTESNHSRFRYGSAWQHRFSDTPGVILFFLLRRCIITENTLSAVGPYSFALTHFFQQRQNEPQPTVSAVVKSTSEQRCERLRQKKQECWLLKKFGSKLKTC